MSSLVFKKVRLVGFKSFVDPTDFLIEPGLTGIVGPNGCGKSNLLEAIRWVMGANSAKAMRASGMEDVIFSGTKTRPGRNQAHVTLTIDNSARVAPPIFNDDDTLEVTRIITAGKGSVYKVNDKTVRAKDVQLLFADASTGANSPALVRQGQINELISAKPENRRRILEEAAGISGLHTRRHEAELRLRAAENNLDRLDDVIQQIESQLTSLRRQSRQAARYKRLAGEIHEYKALLWLKRWEAALENLSAAQDTLKVSNTQVEDLALKASELTRKAAELSGLLEPKREAQIVAAAILGRLNAAKEVLDRDEELARGEVDKLTARLEQLSTDIERENGIAKDAELATARLQAEYEHLSSLTDNSAAIDAAADEAAKTAKARQDIESEYNELMRQKADVNARREAAQSALSQTETRLSRLTSEQSEALEALSRLEGKDGKSADKNLFTAALREAARDLETARQNEQSLQDKRTQVELSDQQAREYLSESRDLHGKLLAEKSAIEKVLNRAGSEKWTRALEQLDVKKGYEKALASALGEDVDAPVGVNAPARWIGAQTPKTALPAGAVALSDFVTAPPELAARLSQIGVIEASQLDALKSQLQPGQRLVTVDGHLYRWDGFEVTSEAETPAAVRLEQQGRLAELEREIQTQSEIVDKAVSDFDSIRAERASAQNAAREARQLLPDLERKERAAHAALTQYETDIARESAQKTALEDRLERLEREIIEVKKQAETIREKLSTYTQDGHDDDKLEGLSETLTEAREKADEASAVWRSLKNESEARAQRLETVSKEISDWKQRGALASERIETLGHRQIETETVLTRATSGPDQFESRRNQLFNDLEAAEARRTSAADDLAAAETELSTAELEAQSATERHNTAREQRAASEARLAAAQEKITDTQDRIEETLGGEPSGLKSMLGELSADSNLTEHDIERKLERLNSEREQMGGVNLRADIEAEEQEKRLVAMRDERDDLLKAIARLREGIDELNSEGRERLLKAFDTVNGHFGRLFKTLFGGGDAALALTESDDPLEAGLEVMASPPGKSLGSMSLMSGGEQALTATALIFAVFLSNPAPLCVLDEVDAPLDDANVGRYCDMLDNMAEQTNTKFVTITHNPVTMSRMNRLFGVTMAEQGVSQLVSMELESAAQLVAAE